jgi:hypothetical protein
MARNMAFEAIAFFKVERLRTPLELRLAATSQIISSLSTCEGLTESQSLWAQAELHYQWALCLSELQEFQDTRKILQKVDRLLDEWCSKTDYAKNGIVGLRFNVQWLRLTTLAEEGNNTLQVYHESIELLKGMEACNHLRTTSVYGIAMNAARRLSREERKPQYHQEYLLLHQNAEIYVDQVLGDVDALLNNQMEMLTAAGRERVGLQSALEWINAFLKQYPTFSLPNTLHALHQVRLTILLILGEDIEDSMEAIERLKPLLPNTFPPDLEDDSFSLDWTNAVLDPEKKFRTAVRLLRNWMVEDLRAGLLSIDCVLTIFGGIDQMKQEAARKTLEENAKDIHGCSDDQIFAVLYLQLPKIVDPTDEPREPQRPPQKEQRDSRSGEVAKEPPQTTKEQPKLPPVTLQDWGTRFTALKRWLGRNSGSQVNGRHCLLLMLQDIRIELLKKEATLFDARLVEYERAIQAYAEVTFRVQNYLSRYVVCEDARHVNRQILVNCTWSLIFGDFSTSAVCNRILRRS